MSSGTPISRQWVLITRSGMVVIDWGEGDFQDVHSGEFIRLNEPEISRPVQDEDLDLLKRAGQVAAYDTKTVYFINLPERPLSTIE
jgi:hypothetical protein